ncbi:hypothetical protein KVT40_003909 [Elsinoe batatas]|uniref:Ribonuclease P protein subunit n=1 Tax=Elsinoe batatas TaxID=2601811 RepID=A0A8K0PFM7_9PEZI|nr:hypothetical protein KVT40_003909 [Elsinoe batatas]
MSTPPTHPALSLLLQSHPPPLAQQIHTDQILHRPLLLRPSSPDPTSSLTSQQKRRNARRICARDAARADKAVKKAGRASLTSRPRPLSAKSKRKLGVYDIPEGERKWGLYEGLHKLWCGYIREVLNISSSSSDGGEREGREGEDAEGQVERVSKGKKKLSPDFVGPMLSSADFHGAVVRVVRSGCVSRVGIRGIVVKDTKFTFEIVTKRDQVKVVPKEGTVFRVEVPVEGDALEEMEVGDEGKGRYVFEVYGEQFMTSAPDRANKKFKMHVDPGL